MARSTNAVSGIVPGRATVNKRGKPYHSGSATVNKAGKRHHARQAHRQQTWKTVSCQAAPPSTNVENGTVSGRATVNKRR
jgi:hypothetical protein